MSGPRYVGLPRLLTVISLAGLWGSVVALRLLWNLLRLGPKRVFGVKTRERRPAILDNPKYGTHHYARLQNIRLHYVSNGEEGRPLILFLHGFPEFWYSWKHQLEEFGQRFRAVAVDMRGYSESDKPRTIEEYHVNHLTSDIKEFIQYLGYKKCVLVGHDWGGLVAWATATRFPEVVERLVICNAPQQTCFMNYLWSRMSQLLKSWYMFFFQVPRLPEILLRSNDLMFVDTSFRSGGQKGRSRNLLNEEDVEAFKYTFHKPGDLTGPVNYYRAALRYELGEAYSGVVRAPTLIIWGTKDRALERGLAEGSKPYVRGDCTICYIEGGSHWIQQEQPEQVNRYIDSFVKGQNPSKI